MAQQCDIGLIGLEVMGRNLVLNMADHGFRVAVFNRTTSKMTDFVNSEEAQGKAIEGCATLEQLVGQLSSPRKIMLMIKSGDPVAAYKDELYPDQAGIDAVIEKLLTMLSPGDLIIDGGNTHFKDTRRRTSYVKSKGLLYVGTGVSGGEEGARYGPSIMPGGTDGAWPLIQPIFQAIAAKVGPADDIPCCEWIGPDGAGHYVKMVHNGIEYGDMQLICEAYWLMKNALGLTNDELYDVFATWNRGELQSYLIEITRDIFSVKDDQGDGELVDKILDTAGAKGTGKWMSQLALDLGVPSTLVTEAVYARSLSALKESRVLASGVLAEPAGKKYEGDRDALVEAIRQGLYASKICSYAQGFVQLRAAAHQYQWPLNYGDCALLWRGGCIIRAVFLERIKEAFDADAELENLLLAPYFQQAVEQARSAWKHVVSTAMDLDIPIPAFASALVYYNGYRSERLPANLLQAQRDYFGAHTYRRVDQEGVFHSDWIRLRREPS